MAAQVIDHSAITQSASPQEKGAGDRDSAPWVFQTGFLLLCGATTLGVLVWAWSLQRLFKRQQHLLNTQLKDALTQQADTQHTRNKVAQQLRELRKQLRMEQGIRHTTQENFQEIIAISEQLQHQLSVAEDQQEQWKLKSEHEAEYEELLEVENQRLEMQIQALSQELLKAENYQRILAKLYSNPLAEIPIEEETTITLFSAELDYYPGEHKSIIHDALRQALLRVWNQSRRQDIIKSILQHNTWEKINKERRDEVHRLFRSHEKMDRKMRSELRKIDLEVLPGKTHYKIRFGDDDHYTYFISKTPSDRRSGKNAASDICNLFL